MFFAFVFFRRCFCYVVPSEAVRIFAGPQRAGCAVPRDGVYVRGACHRQFFCRLGGYLLYRAGADAALDFQDVFKEPCPPPRGEYALSCAARPRKGFLPPQQAPFFRTQNACVCQMPRL